MRAFGYRGRGREVKEESKYVFIQSIFSGDTENPYGGTFCFLQDNHTSVQGMRERAAERGAEVVCVGHQEVESMLHGPPCHGVMEETVLAKPHEGQCQGMSSSVDGPRRKNRSLFVYPAQSNFSGRKYSLEWIQRIQDDGLNFSAAR